MLIWDQNSLIVQEKNLKSNFFLKKLNYFNS